MNFFNRYKNYILVLIIILLIIFVGNSLTSETTVNEKASSITEVIKKGNIAEKVLVTGRVETANYLTVNTSVNGIVKKILVKEGDKVYKGQKIMEIKLNNDGEIDYQNALNSYNSSKISLEKAKSELRSKESDVINKKYIYERIRDKNRDSTEKENEFITAENNFKSAEDALSIHKESIKHAESSLYKSFLTLQSLSPVILAPEEGIISNILFVEGMDITNSLSERSSVSVASIKNEGKSIVSFTVSELDINKINVGQNANLSLSSIDKKTFTGEVVGTDKVGVIASNLAQYSIIIRLNEESDKILPNMKVEGEIIINEKENVLLAPVSSIKKGNKNIVTLESGEKREVIIGISDGVFTEIISGLAEGERVIIEALPTSGFINNSSNSRIPGGLFGR